MGALPVVLGAGLYLFSGIWRKQVNILMEQGASKIFLGFREQGAEADVPLFVSGNKAPRM